MRAMRCGGAHLKYAPYSSVPSGTAGTRPAGATTMRCTTRSACACAKWIAVKPPNECPSSTIRASLLQSSHPASISTVSDVYAAGPAAETRAGGAGDRPHPGRSRTCTSATSAMESMTASQCAAPALWPCSSSTAGRGAAASGPPALESEGAAAATVALRRSSKLWTCHVACFVVNRLQWWRTSPFTVANSTASDWISLLYETSGSRKRQPKNTAAPQASATSTWARGRASAGSAAQDSACTTSAMATAASAYAPSHTIFAGSPPCDGGVHSGALASLSARLLPLLLVLANSEEAVREGFESR